MELADLRVFEAVAQHGSMNRAAAALNTVQSGVTARIRALEERLEVKLFERHARGVALTAAGQRLLPFAGRAQKLLADAVLAARDDGTPAGTLQLGSLETVMALHMAPALRDYARRYPQVLLEVMTGTSQRLLEDVLKCRLEGALVAGPVNHPELEQRCLFEEELVLVTASRFYNIEMLNELEQVRTIVFQPGCSYRQRLESWLASRGIISTEAMAFGSLDVILSCVSAGIGVTLLPRRLIEQRLMQSAVAIHTLPESYAHAQTLFVHRKGSYLSSAMTEFLAILSH